MANNNNGFSMAQLAASLGCVVSFFAIVAGGYNITTKLVRIETHLEINKELIKAGTSDRWTQADMRRYSASLKQLNSDIVVPLIPED